MAAAAALLWVGGGAHARTTFTVDSTADTPGNCGVAGQCTLRAAIAAADAAGGSNIVTLPAGTYTFTAGALSVTGNAAAAQVVETVTVPTPKFTVEVQLAGTGAGTVTSSPSGIACGSTCTADFDAGTTVTLSAAAGSGSTFAGWSGACAGSGACVLTRAGTVVAAFAHATPPPSVKCVVPNVKGKSLATAKRKIGAAHCATGRITQAKSKTVKKGNVMSQTPKPGEKLARGAKVNLVVSRGKR